MPSAVAQSPNISIEQFWSAWFENMAPNANLTYINTQSSDGHCYLKLLCFFTEFGLCDPIRLMSYVQSLKEKLGQNPHGIDALTEVCIGFYTITSRPVNDTHLAIGELSDEESKSISSIFTRVYDEMKVSIARLELTDSDGVLHLSGNPSVQCNCTGPVCVHGWTFHAASVLMASNGKRVGASGFDLNQFMNNGLGLEEEELDFEDVYSSFEPNLAEKAPKIAKWVKSVDDVPSELTVKPKPANSKPAPAREAKPVEQYLDARGFAPQPNHGRPKQTEHAAIREELRSKVRKEMSDNAELSELKEQVKALTATVARSSLSVQNTVELEPNDSSSVVERYTSNKRFMPSGTVLNHELVRNYHGASVGSTNLTVQDDLTSGFTQDDDSRNREQHFVKKLKPINGLPRPFACTRLNFLMNLSSGLERSMAAHPTELLRCLYNSMNSDSIVPVDNLLKQVLCTTIDRQEGFIVANPFRLPYIEIGMHISVATITAMLDLVMIEYRQLWFQEFKGLKIPSFSNTYDDISQDPIQRASRKKSEQRTKQQRAEPPKHSRTRTILGL